MAIHEDYYRILQVHFLAEPEVIESAFKRLAKKYHPDVNRTAGAELRMKKINEAYETLRDGAKRRAYDAQRSFSGETPRSEHPRSADGGRPADSGRASSYERPKPETDPPCPRAAIEALTQYFDRIMSGDFSGAYELITAADKKNITADDFRRWQSGVARIYGMREYSFIAGKLDTGRRLGGHFYPQTVEFSINTVEHNTVMGRQEKDTVSKSVVLEDKSWRIFVGFDDIRPYIARFEELSGLLAAKSVIKDMEEHYSTKDSGTGLYNKKGFSEAAQREVWRYNRYGNVFSVMLLEVDLGREARQHKNQELFRITAAWAGKILSDSFRNLDILGRWGETGFIVLLPETNLGGCFKAAKKIKNIFEAAPLVYGKRQPVKLSVGIEEFNGSLEDTIRNLSDYISVAGKARKSCVVYRGGIYE
jgi:diguanylate cyclase (GGDEF)-like protein